MIEKRLIFSTYFSRKNKVLNNSSYFVKNKETNYYKPLFYLFCCNSLEFTT